jgi:hypothetical protein
VSGRRISLHLYSIEASPPISVAFKGFKAKWNGHPLKTAGGRAALAIEDQDIELAARQLLSKDPLPQCLLPTESHAELRSSLAAGFSSQLGDHFRRERPHAER